MLPILYFIKFMFFYYLKSRDEEGSKYEYGTDNISINLLISNSFNFFICVHIFSYCNVVYKFDVSLVCQRTICI